MRRQSSWRLKTLRRRLRGLNSPLASVAILSGLACGGAGRAESAGAAASTPTAVAEVYVTARKRTERLIDAPVTITALDVGLITDSPDSPHLAPEKTDAELYFGFAEFDDWVPLSRAPELTAELQSRKANTEIEVYHGAHHGFVSPERDVYCKWAAERHYERLFSLFRRRLVA